METKQGFAVVVATYIHQSVAVESMLAAAHIVAELKRSLVSRFVVLELWRFAGAAAVAQSLAVVESVAAAVVAKPVGAVSLLVVDVATPAVAVVVRSVVVTKLAAAVAPAAVAVVPVVAVAPIAAAVKLLVAAEAVAVVAELAVVPTVAVAQLAVSRLDD